LLWARYLWLICDLNLWSTWPIKFGFAFSLSLAFL
jgi:hypothetical protein